MNDEFYEFELSPKSAHDPRLIVPPSLRKFGGSSADVSTRNIQIRVGRRPVIKNLRKLYQLSKREVPADIEIFESYDVWILSNTFGILQTGGFESVKQVGIHVDLAESPICTNIGLLPTTEFIKHGEIGVGVDAKLGVDGRLEVPTIPFDVMASESFSAGGRLALSTEASVAGRVTLSLISTAIQAIGTGDRRSVWLFERVSGRNPLVGDQTVMQVILTPRHLERLAFTASVFATISTWGVVTTRLKGPELSFEVMTS